mmetsp:Transcript_16973/g.25921  ORF Transcript_16973/g.25921 Transcript_16973/m.25921 type:complete len:87 (+) Transcript_16973:298-558(+)
MQLLLHLPTKDSKQVNASFPWSSTYSSRMKNPGSFLCIAKPLRFCDTTRVSIQHTDIRSIIVFLPILVAFSRCPFLPTQFSLLFHS